MNERPPVTRMLAPTKPKRPVLSVLATVLIASAALAGCSSTEQLVGRSDGKAKVDPKLGVAPSPRVVAFGQKVPKGGGRAIVGEPYKVAGKRYVPRLDPDYEKVGYASWYGNAFHGRRTANGEVYDSEHLSAAHPTMPLPSYARVTSVATGRSVIVRVNDRGPFHSNRVIDISRRTADMLGVRTAGIAKVKVEYVGPAPTEGDDTAFLVASYRGPADVAPSLPETMIASAESLPGLAADAAGSVATAAAGLIGAGSGDTQAAEPVAVASAENLAPVGPMVPDTVLPPNRPVVAEEAYVVVASVDPADVYLAGGGFAVASAPMAASVQPVAFTPASFQVGPQPAMMEPAAAAQPAAAVQPATDAPLPPMPPVIRQSYAEERVSAAYAAMDGMGEGVALSALVDRLEAMAAPAVDHDAGPVLQAGLFRSAENAGRLAAALSGIGTVSVDDIAVNGKPMKRVRLSALAVSVEEAVAAAERAGARGVQILR